MKRLLVFMILLATPAVAGAQEFDDPAVTVCELLIRPQFEIERNVYKRLSASVEGSRAALDFEWGVADAKPKTEHVECPFRLDAEGFVLDISNDVLAPAASAIVASGLSPIPQDKTALSSE